jgi:hypothetical protein
VPHSLAISAGIGAVPEFAPRLFLDWLLALRLCPIVGTRSTLGSAATRRGATAMNGQRVIRQAGLVAVAAALVLSGAGPVKAAGEDFADDIASGAQMKGICEDFGGDFTDTEDGNLWCQWDDGSQTVCDTDGKDCYDIPARRLPTDHWPEIVAGGEVLGAAPGDVPDSTPDSQEDAPRVGTPDDQGQNSGHSKSKGNKGKKGKRGGKHRR